MPRNSNRLLACRLNRLFPYQWKAYFKTGFAGLGFKLDFAAVTVADNAVADDEAESGPFADCFRREKRLEHVCLHFRGNSGTVVYDFDHQLILFQSGADADFAAPIHGINGVVYEVGPDLIQFATVSHDARHGPVESPDERHVF